MIPDSTTPAVPSVDRRSAGSFFTGPLAAFLVLLVSYLLMLESVRDKSITIDEPGHAAAGYAYWKLGDYRLDPENGNLPKRVAALPLLFGPQTYDPTTSRYWQPAHAMLLRDAFFNRSNLDTASLVARGRAACALLAVALSLVVWLWSRQLFGPVGGMIALVACAFNPGVLANGPLMTSDMAVTLFFTLAIWRIWATLERVTPGRVIGSTLAVGGLFVSKMSAPLIVPMTLLLVLARLFDGRPLPFGLKQLHTRAQKLGAIAFVGGLHFLGVIVIVWAFFGFRFSAFSPDLPGPARFNEPWAMAFNRPDVPATLDLLELTPSQRTEAAAILNASGVRSNNWTNNAVEAFDRIKARVLRPEQAARLTALQESPPEKLIPRLAFIARNIALLPEAYIYGLVKVTHLSKQTRSFLNGEVSSTGWKLFFPYLFLVKTPLPMLALLLLAAVALWHGWPAATAPPASAEAHRPNLLGRLWPTLPLWILIGVYGSVAISSGLNLGHRHLLPIYPALFVLCGMAGRWFSFAPDAALRRGGLTVGSLRLATLALVGVLVVEVGARFPNYIAYFNGIVAPSQAYKHVVDSSLDWGQELPAIARYLRERPNQPSYLAYLGLARPSYHGINSRMIGGHLGVDWKLEAPITALVGRTEDEIDAFLTNFPQWNSGLRLQVSSDPARPTILFRRGDSLRLAGGIYVISATMLQPLYHNFCNGPWTVEYETTYQRLRSEMAPMLSDDVTLRAQQLTQKSPNEWLAIYDAYITYRFARLTAYLRQRQPDDQINHSVLVYHLTDAEVRQALDGPPPPS